MIIEYQSSDMTFPGSAGEGFYPLASDCLSSGAACGNDSGGGVAVADRLKIIGYEPPAGMFG
jgi:hypothetical protein